MRILHLTLKKKWFDMICSRVKKEEYREIKPYWMKRLICDIGRSCQFIDENGNVKGHMLIPTEYFRRFDTISANNGYTRGCPNVKWKHKGIRIGKPNPAWCEPEDVGKDVFILEIGEILN